MGIMGNDRINNRIFRVGQHSIEWHAMDRIKGIRINGEKLREDKMSEDKKEDERADT